jgi:hypothetical protein
MSWNRRYAVSQGEYTMLQLNIEEVDESKAGELTATDGPPFGLGCRRLGVG